MIQTKKSPVSHTNSPKVQKRVRGKSVNAIDASAKVPKETEKKKKDNPQPQQPPHYVDNSEM